MSRIVAPPFRRPRADLISAGPWMVTVPGRTSENPDRIDGWDYSTSVEVRRTMSMDREAILEDCGLPTDVPLGWSLQWHSSLTNSRGWSEVTAAADDETCIALHLPGAELGGTLRLASHLLLRSAVSVPSQLAPHRSGSILWSDALSVLLEGSSARFPMQVVDFDAAGHPREACWILQWSPEELESPTLGTVRLLLNGAHPVIRELLESGTSQYHLEMVLSALRHDMRRQLVHGALDVEGFNRDDDYGDGTLGSSLQGILDLTFGDQSLESIRGLRQRAPSELEARLQAASRLFLTTD